MSRLGRIQHTLEQSADHPRMASMLAGVDQFASILGHANYQGSNPAIASAYAPMRAGLIAITAIVLITLIFGVLIPLESAAIAQGKVVVLSKSKTVQHLEGGVVKAILVNEGELVKQGQPLMEISDIAPKATQEIVQSELWMARASETRLRALQRGEDSIHFPQKMQEAANHLPELKETMQSQAKLFATQHEAQQGKLGTLKQRIKQSKEEINGLNAQLKSTRSQLALLSKEIESVSKLLEQGLATKSRLLSLKRQAEELRGNQGQYTSLIAKTQQRITETNMEVINLENEFSTRIAEELGEVHSRIKDQDEKLRAATDIVTRSIIRSPSEGIVTGLQFHTIGGVVAPGEPVMDIVPQGEQLVLEVQVNPIDIDVVKAGLESRVIFSAYKSRRMPLLTGTVTQVSANSFQEQQGLESYAYYKARVEVDAEELSHLDASIKLHPGMPADVFINTGTRTFLSYLFSPLTDSFNHAFKED